MFVIASIICLFPASLEVWVLLCASKLENVDLLLQGIARQIGIGAQLDASLQDADYISFISFRVLSVRWFSVLWPAIVLKTFLND